MSNEPREMGTPYKLMTEDEVMQVKVLVSSLRAENAKLRDDLATLHKVAGMVAQSGGDSLTQMAHDLSAAIEKLRAENARLRALLPSAEVREMIKWYVDGDLSGEIAPKFAYHQCYAALEWLDRLENEESE